MIDHEYWVWSELLVSNKQTNMRIYIESFKALFNHNPLDRSGELYEPKIDLTGF